MLLSKAELSEKRIRVIRIGHRFVRDDRTITHLCLVSRALGAEAIYLQEVEKKLIQTVQDVNEAWGGHFQVLEEPSWKKIISAAKKQGALVVHLTMYGTPLMEKLEKMRSAEDILIIVGGPKVPGNIYKMSDYNIAVTNQPHSEVGALAVLLHEIQEGEELAKDFVGHRLRIIPQDRGKKVVTT